ncbi:MAG: hypothetical protein K2G86_05015, partial [Prevotella sp.]|nr:hypothetical protein [Prevotella sp.]
PYTGVTYLAWLFHLMNRLYVFHPIGYLIEFQPFVGLYLGASSDGMTATSSLQRGGVQSLKSH